MQEPGASVLAQTVNKVMTRLESDTAATLSLHDAELEAEGLLETSDQGEDVLGCTLGLTRVWHLLEACPEPAKQSKLALLLSDILKVLQRSFHMRNALCANASYVCGFAKKELSEGSSKFLSFTELQVTSLGFIVTIVYFKPDCWALSSALTCY